MASRWGGGGGGGSFKNGGGGGGHLKTSLFQELHRNYNNSCMDHGIIPVIK